MSTPVDEIYNFHRIRTACHLASVNYFADIIGYHFPEHDNDKNFEPIRTGYAYKNYATYHKSYRMFPAYGGVFQMAHATHHAHASHHIDFYGGDVSRIAKMKIWELVLAVAEL